jgi:hypothetical protein
MKTLFQLMVIAIFVFTGSLVYSQQTQTQPQTDQSADSPLMQAAKKERERREKMKTAGKPVKSFTNQDIQEFKAKNKDMESSTEGEQAEEATESETTTETTTTATDPSQNEEMWRKRSREAAERIKNAEEKLATLQTDINALTQAFYAESDGVAQRGQIEAERNARLAELEATKKEVEAAKQAQEDLRDEARRAGALPGWIED